MTSNVCVVCQYARGFSHFSHPSPLSGLYLLRIHTFNFQSRKRTMSPEEGDREGGQLIVHQI